MQFGVHNLPLFWGDIMSYLRRILKTALNATSEVITIASEAIGEVAAITKDVATEVEKPAK